MSIIIEAPTEAGHPNPLADIDSHASQVRAFLRSVQLRAGTCWCRDTGVHAGRKLIEDFAFELIKSGDSAQLELKPSEAACVLRFLSSIEPRENCEGYSDGGIVSCGLNIVLDWVADQVDEP